MRLPVCAECDRLWREYANATIAHVKAENNLKTAALRHDTEAIIQITLVTEQAFSVRENLREAIREHEAIHGKEERAAT
jgi:hypothetical protein